MILFYITSFSDLMANLLLEQAIKYDVFVATPRREVYDIVSSWDITGLWLTTDIAPDRREIDALFKEDFMPGIFGDATFAGTDLPLWQVLSLDRLKFWYQPHIRSEVDFLRSMAFDRAYVSLDMGDAIPFALARIFDVTAVKTEPIRTREILDIAPYLEFDEYIVGDEPSAKFLRPLVSGDVRLIEAAEKPLPKYTDKGKLREAMGISGDVIGVMFDPKYERQCLKLFRVFDAAGWPTVFVFPIHERAAELLPIVLGEYARKFSILEKYDTMAVCDEIVAFSYDGNYFGDPPARMVVYDVNGLNKSFVRAPEYEHRGMPS